MSKKKSKIIKLLAEFIGVNKDDLDPDDSFVDDLRMSVIDISSFAEDLTKNGFDIDQDKFMEVETISDLIEMLEDDI